MEFCGVRKRKLENERERRFLSSYLQTLSAMVGSWKTT